LPGKIEFPSTPDGGRDFIMSFEMNKIAGAILMAMIVAMVSGLIAAKLVAPKKIEKNVYEVAVAPEATTSTEAAAKPAAPEPIGRLLAAANVDAGKKNTAVCLTCHNFEKGQPNKIGPNLYGIVGDEIAHGRGSYAFSDALKSKGGTWTVDNLNAWLTSPQAFAKGTKMTFAGISKAQERANIIAYLNTLSDHPKPLPTAPAPGAVSPKPASTAPAQPTGK
jgi:cytochrome c